MTNLSAYPIATLFDLREKSKKEAEDAYARAKQIENNEKKKLNDMQKQLHDMQTLRVDKREEYTHESQTKLLNIDEIQVRNRHIEKLLYDEKEFEKNVAAQKDTTDKATIAAEAAMQTVLQTTQDYKVLEKHREKWLKEQKKIEQNKEEAAADDIAQAQFFSRHKSEE